MIQIHSLKTKYTKKWFRTQGQPQNQDSPNMPGPAPLSTLPTGWRIKCTLHCTRSCAQCSSDNFLWIFSIPYVGKHFPQGFAKYPSLTGSFWQLLSPNYATWMQGLFFQDQPRKWDRTVRKFQTALVPQHYILIQSHLPIILHKSQDFFLKQRTVKYLKTFFGEINFNSTHSSEVKVTLIPSKSPSLWGTQWLQSRKTEFEDHDWRLTGHLHFLYPPSLAYYRSLSYFQSKTTLKEK